MKNTKLEHNYYYSTNIHVCNANTMQHPSITQIQERLCKLRAVLLL